MQLLDYEKEHLEILRKYLPECMVLLKNETDFTVDHPCKIALFGNGVRHTLKGGTGSGEVNSRYTYNVEQCFEKTGFTVTSKEWLDAYAERLANARVEFVKTVKQEARAAHTNAMVYGMGRVMPEPEYDIPLKGEGEIAVYVLSRICGEGNDRKAVAGDLLLSETEIRDILALQKQYGKFLLALNVGGPVDLKPVLSVENILVLSQLGVDTASALAKIVLGISYPSGKLAATWSCLEDLPEIGEFGNQDDTRYREGIYVGYRYFDIAQKEPLFPFGYGLGFTTFEIGVQEICLEGSRVTVEAVVTNTGKRPGKETAQIYVSVPEGKLDQPCQALAGFAKTKELLPGEQEQVRISFDMKEIASYDAERALFILEAGNYIVRAGNSSRNTFICGCIKVVEEQIVRQVKNCLGKPDFTDIRLPRPKDDIPSDVEMLTLAPDAIVPEVVAYHLEPEVDPITEVLTDEQLVYLNVGGFNPKAGITGVIGNAGIHVCGAAGETASVASESGVQPLVMADGPAGLRLSRDYFKDEKGMHAVGNPLIDSMADFMGAPLKRVMNLLNKKPEKGQEILHQYATAIPIGTAIAQSWNLEFARLCGDIVGDEMERFGVHLWLAPALNIHRNVLCGRNFEYYSEDPLVSGKMAAAITDGVQKHPGCGTTVKHFAANNQETNRYGNNSQVSERAMREIYLKGFEICVREAQPHALMTSYNLLNGIHTSERRDLLEDILRSEFGFQGIVMTDWVVAGMADGKNAKYAAPEAYKVASAGNDLFMPGSKKEIKNLTEALRAGKITRKQLEINATRIIRMAKLLAGSK